MNKTLKKFLITMFSIGVIGTMTNSVDAAGRVAAPECQARGEQGVIKAEKLKLEKKMGQSFSAK